MVKQLSSNKNWKKTDGVSTPIRQVRFFPPSSPGDQHSTLCLYEFDYSLGTSCKWNLTVFILLRLAYFTLFHNLLKIHSRCCMCENWSIKKAEAEELMLLNCGVGEDS